MIGLLVVAVSIALRLSDAPTLLFAIIPSAILLLPQFAFRRRLNRRWDAQTQAFSEAHPSVFLETIRKVRLAGYAVEFGAVIVAVGLFHRLNLNRLPLDPLVLLT
jgi:hypothetical protein